MLHPNGMQVRWLGTSAVVADVVRLVNDVYAEAERGLWRDGTTRTTAAEVAELVAAGELAAAYRNGQLVGVVRVAADGAEFGLLAAAPEHRGAGVGRALVDFAEDRGRERGAPVMRLELLVPREFRHPGKQFLQAWYGRRGYHLVGTTSVAAAHPQFAALLATPCDVERYEKPLTVHTGWSRTG
jgi:GNAT superfamily N-acetyltransferase